MKVINSTSYPLSIGPHFFFLFFAARPDGSTDLLNFTEQFETRKLIQLTPIWGHLRIFSCLACVYRVMDARGKFGEHERCVRFSRGDSRVQL